MVLDHILFLVTFYFGAHFVLVTFDVRSLLFSSLLKASWAELLFWPKLDLAKLLMFAQMLFCPNFCFVSTFYFGPTFIFVQVSWASLVLTQLCTNSFISTLIMSQLLFCSNYYFVPTFNFTQLLCLANFLDQVLFEPNIYFGRNFIFVTLLFHHFWFWVNYDFVALYFGSLVVLDNF